MREMGTEKRWSQFALLGVTLAMLAGCGGGKYHGAQVLVDCTAREGEGRLTYDAANSDNKLTGPEWHLYNLRSRQKETINPADWNCAEPAAVRRSSVY